MMRTEIKHAYMWAIFEPQYHRPPCVCGGWGPAPHAADGGPGFSPNNFCVYVSSKKGNLWQFFKAREKRLERFFTETVKQVLAPQKSSKKVYKVSLGGLPGISDFCSHHYVIVANTWLCNFS